MKRRTKGTEDREVIAVVEQIAIIGCGAAGATAALQARKFNRKVPITIFNSEKYSQYSRCGLPYTISGKVRSFDDLILMPPDNWSSLNINAELGVMVTQINHDEREVVFEDAGGEQQLRYDALIFATGARNADPPIKGLDKKRVYGLRTLDDVKLLARETDRAKKAVIIGGGLIGMETAEAFLERGLDVTVVEFLPHILLAMVDSDMAQLIEDHCRDHGLKILTNTAAKELTGGDQPTSVVVQNRESEYVSEIPADFVVVATGVRPTTEFAAKMGAEIGPTRGIKTDDRMMTNIQDVYAVGDCAENVEFITRTPLIAGLGTVAVRQGRIAGINAAGGDLRFPGIVGAKVTKLFGLEIASTGLTEEMANRLEVPIVKGSIRGGTKPPYFVGGKDLKLKTFFHKDTGKLVGGQLVGLEDAAMRLNVLTLGIQQDIDAQQLFDFENCYAPAIADTWDPLVQAADAAQKRLKH